MADKTYSDRDIILELFPATRAHLIPAPFPYAMYPLAEGALRLEHQQKQQTCILKPVTPAGKAATLLCCDLCKHQASRSYIQMYRAELNGRRTRYLSLCRQHSQCALRQISSQPIASIERLFEAL